MTLVMYNQSEVKPLGKKRFRVKNPKNNEKYSIEIHIVGGVSPCKSILGLMASKHHLAVDSNDVDHVNLKKEDCISLYKYVFSEEGKIEGYLHLEIDKNVHPVQLPTKRVPIALKERFKQELDRLSNIGMIQKVDTPTEWISPVVITSKKIKKIPRKMCGVLLMKDHQQRLRLSM